jgi:hypothetical protein
MLHVYIKYQTEAELFDEIETKSVQSFPPRYSHSPIQLCHEISISSNSRNLLQFLQLSYCTLLRRNEENLIEKPYGFRNPYRNLKSENSQDYQDYAQQPQCNCTFMNSVSGQGLTYKYCTVMFT